MNNSVHRFTAPNLVMLAMAAVLPLLTQSCGLLVSGTQPVTINAPPPEADIYVDGAFIGKESVAVDLQRNHAHTVQARFEGRVATATIGTKLSEYAVLDIIGGLLIIVPFIGLAGDGARSLTKTSIALTVPPKDAKPTPEPQP